MERKELVQNIIDTPANQFGEEDRAWMMATPIDTLERFLPDEEAVENELEFGGGGSMPDGKLEEPLVAPNFSGQGEVKNAEDDGQPLVAPAMSFEKK